MSSVKATDASSVLPRLRCISAASVEFWLATETLTVSATTDSVKG